MKIAAEYFKYLFKIPFFRKRYYGFYKKIFKPYELFRDQVAICRIDNNLKIKAELDEWIQQHIYLLGTWDERATRFLKHQLKTGDVFLDIGANIGYFSLIASELVGSEGQVHSFEPVTKVYKQFIYNIELNNLKNITANQKAVFEKKAVLEIYVSAKENAGMSSIFHHDTESGEVEMVEAMTIDDYVEMMDIQKINLVKIDIEGAELFALKGMKKTVRRFKPVILMELSDEVLKNSLVEGKEVLDLMNSFGYERKRIFKCGNTGEITGSESDYTNFAFFYID